MTAGIQITTRKAKVLPTVRGVLWEGPSPIDGAPLFAVVTDHTKNGKISHTGRVLQVWIMRADMHPNEGRKTGGDSSVCGDCPFAGGNGCYVNTNPLGAIFRAYKRGAYRRVSVDELRGRQIRFGAYGDPALLPRDLVTTLARDSSGWFGYTHQWRNPRFAWTRGFFMASTETPAGLARALREGWRAFHLDDPDNPAPIDGTILCLAESRGITCEDCGLCDGTREGKRGNVKSIRIPGHGSAPVVKRLRATLARL